jgi:hypothetical protein
MDMTTAGEPLAPNASKTLNAPAAPTMPANNDQAMPLGAKFHEAPFMSKMAKGARTAVRK